ncbi:MAG: hypothetical protein IJU81_08825 [Bacteroidales bacterium]|nr:hypothetical protein [Bacteroidales bacterium]
MSLCTICPRQCLVDRQVRTGFCGATATPEVASIAIHRGEEPVLSGERGVCNLFFAHCNLGCIYCQNNEISRRVVAPDKIFYHSLDEVADRIGELLQSSEPLLGFVSPSHYADSIPAIMEAIWQRGLHPTTIYNTNCYDSIETLRSVDPYIDIYLPDLKYSDPQLAARYSNAADYPAKARAALLEMVRLRGTRLLTGDDGLAFRGIIVRHLVLPGAVDNSIETLNWIADNIGNNIHLSLMGQYRPPDGMPLPDELYRTLNSDEYNTVVSHMQQLGFSHGWTQSLDASESCLPNFSKKDSFK